MTDWFTEEDVERAARAMCVAYGVDAMSWGIGETGPVRRAWELRLDEARAALSAVRPNQWRTMESAPKDGTPFIGGFYGIRWADSHRVGDVVRCWWQPEFNAFISSCRKMFLADGYTFEDGSTSQLHHPVIEPITCWTPLPQPPEGEK